MRIVAKIATAGVAGLSRFPVSKYTIDECLVNGRLDPIKTRQALNVEQVQIGSRDDFPVLAFTLEYLTQQRSVVERMAENINHSGETVATVTEDKGIRTEAATLGDGKCERNMRRNRVAYVRTDISNCTDGLHVKLSVLNPKEVVGHTEKFAREYALICARIFLYLRDNIKTTKITLIEGEGVSGLYAEAELMNKQQDLSSLRKSCNRLHNGNCSPCKFDCPLYHNGKCRDPFQD